MFNLLDYISGLISRNSRVLDLGCGDGRLLGYLKSHNDIIGYGIEKNLDNVKVCIREGHNVFQGDLDECLLEFKDNSYDVAILSYTLQEITKPLDVLNDMLRVAKRSIVIFPNFAFWKARFFFLLGFAPKFSLLPYEWHNTPNIRLITIKDFKHVCKVMNYKIVHEKHLYSSSLLRRFMPLCFGNFFCTRVLFCLEQGDSSTDA
ncbi:MAG: methionine biosynthesis protein MetW [bacterium]